MAEILTSLVKPAMEELGRVTVATIKRQFNYLCCLKSNIQNLTDEAEKLGDARAGLQMQVEAAENKGEVIVPEIKTWLENASNKIEVDKRGIDDEIPTIKNGCLSIKSRFLLSRKVKQTADAMKDLRERCNDFKKVSEPAPPASKVAIPQGTSCEFESRKQIENEIMEDLRGRKVNMMGICGMGGVGKTTMAGRIMERVREEKLFDEVVMAVVSQPVNMLKIQGEIAELMGLELKEESLSARAYKLYARLSGANRFLLILDDVWERVKLKELGIPCESDQGCTIILTSRSRDVLREMNAQLYEMKILSETEAWFLFREKVGIWIDDSDLLSVAKEVVEECKGLPLSLTTVGTTLKNEKSENIWKDALQQLKISNPIDMPHVLTEVYKPIKLSYDFLDNHHARSLFLLCCLFPEDWNISLDYLAMYGIGLRMFEGMSVEEVRNRVCTLCKMLKGRFLLLDGLDENHVKMHDVIRDVALFIASEEGCIDRNLSLKHCSREESINCMWISVIGEQIDKLPIDLSFPSLRLLLLMDSSQKVSEIGIVPTFFEGMKELNVLSFSDISCRDISCRSLPKTTKLLKNLRTLYLNRCNSLETISIVGELLSLEILICRSCHKIAELPVEIGRLERLKLLEVSNCKNLKRIAPEVICKLVQLEELIIVESFVGWERKENGKQRVNAALCELEHLKNLTRLEIEFNNFCLVAEEFCLPSKIVNCRIGFSSKSRTTQYFLHHERAMHLILEKGITLGKWIHVLLRSSHYLCTEGDGSFNLDLAQAQNLKRLVYKNCSMVNKLVNITTSMDFSYGVFPFLEYLELGELSNLEEICKLPKSSNSFRNLKELSIFSCPKLRKLFPLPTTKDGLLLLEKLELRQCAMMEEVFANEENEKDGDHCHMITFPKLKELILLLLPNLTTFCKGSESIKFPLLNKFSIEGCGNLFCNQKVSFGSSLKEIIIAGYDNITSIEGFIKHGIILQLEVLKIGDCKMMEEVISNEKDIGEQCHRITFPQLKSLVLYNLQRLTSFCKGSESIDFPLLEKITIHNCKKLTSLISASTSCDSLNLEGHDDDSVHLFCNQKVSFGSLKEINVGYYHLSNMWCHQLPVSFFSQLGTLRIWDCGVIRSLFSSSIAENLVNLERLEICECNEMVKVIDDINEEMLAADQKPHCILFPSLKTLILFLLPKLQSFCNWRCDIQLPSLIDVDIGICRLLEFFTMGSVNAPQLKYVYIDRKLLELKRVGGLNDAVQQYIYARWHNSRRTPAIDRRIKDAEADHAKSKIKLEEEINEEFTSAQVKD